MNHKHVNKKIYAEKCIVRQIRLKNAVSYSIEPVILKSKPIYLKFK